MKFNSSQHRSLLQEALLALNENKSVLRQIDPSGKYVRIARQLARRLGGGEVDAQRVSDSSFVMTISNDIDSAPDKIKDPMLELGLSNLMKSMGGRSEEEDGPLEFPIPSSSEPPPEQPDDPFAPGGPLDPNQPFDFGNRQPASPQPPGGNPFFFDPSVISPFDVQDPNNPPPPPTDPLTGFPQEGEYVWFGNRWLWIPEGGIGLDGIFGFERSPFYDFMRDTAVEGGDEYTTYFDDLAAQQEIADIINDIPGFPFSVRSTPETGPGVPSPGIDSPSPTGLPGIDWDFDGDIDEDELFKAIQDGEIRDWDDVSPFFGENWELEIEIPYNDNGDSFGVTVDDDEVLIGIFWYLDENGRWRTRNYNPKRKRR